MRELVYPITLILMGWITFFAICFGLGRAIFRLCRIRYCDDYLGLIVFWIGWGTLIAFLQLWHLAFRIDARAFAVVTIVAIMSLIVDSRTLLHDFYRFVRTKPVLSIIIVLVTLMLANRAMQPLRDYDSGLYHLQALRWMEEYPIVTGLANLHGRFGFNNANFLYVAFVSIGPWQSIALNIANSLLVVVICIQALIGLNSVIRHYNRWRMHHVFSVLMIIPILDYIVYRPYISSPNSDLASGMVQITLMVLMVEFLERRDFSSSRAVFQLAIMTFLASLATVIKLSAGVFSVAIVVVGTSVWLVHYRPQFERAIKVFLLLGLIAGVLIIPWMVRGLLLSGYPLYPATFAAAPVDWRVPSSSAESEAKWIFSWARLSGHQPEEVLGSWDWLIPWLEQQRSNPTAYLPAILMGITVILVAVRFVFNRKALFGLGAAWAFLIPAFVAVLAWFFSAPDPRFVISLLWGTAIGGFTIAIAAYSRSWPGLFVALLMATIVIWDLVPSGSLRIAAGPDRGFHPIPSVEVKTYETETGLVLYRPATGDQCWNAPLPCTPYPTKTLQLRGERLESGFRLGASE